jgi:hypothetical protein
MKAAMRSQRDCSLAWPEIGFWAVHPRIGFRYETGCSDCPGSRDLAVLARWGVIFLLVYRRPQWRWALVGPSLMTAIVLVTWFASAVLTPQTSRGVPLDVGDGSRHHSLVRQPFSSVDTSGCPDHRPCERSRRRSRSFDLAISCWFRSRRDAASHTAL